MIEQEVKLSFAHVEAARHAVVTAGGRLLAARRLLDDCLYDTVDAVLRRSGRALRLRREPERAWLTFKGPVRPGPVKAREELETLVGDAQILERVLGQLGYHAIFRSQKYREEYELGLARLAVDEAPVGVFVEIEGAPDEIERVAGMLGRTPADYQLDSYLSLWRRQRAARGLQAGDMLFSSADASTPDA